MLIVPTQEREAHAGGIIILSQPGGRFIKVPAHFGLLLTLAADRQKNSRTAAIQATLPIPATPRRPS